MPASDWDSDYAALLNMTGAGGWFVDKLVLQQDSNHDDSLHLPNQGMAISKDWHINVGESHQYTRSVGLVSYMLPRAHSKRPWSDMLIDLVLTERHT